MNILPTSCLSVAALATSCLGQSEAFTVTGSGAGAQLGWAIAGLGDVDADGFGDFIVGAPRATGQAPTSGIARVVSGFDGTTIHTALGTSTGDEFGWSVSGLGDVTGDGVPDFVVGTPFDDDTGNNSGSAQVYSGANGAALFVVRGAIANGEFGTAVAGLGDVNGDGWPDFAVGAPLPATTTGLVRVFSGTDGSVIRTLTGDSIGDRFGSALAGPGDTDGDGVPDLAVGARGDDDNGPQSGSVRLHSGADGATLFTVLGAAAGDELGESVAGAGDVNGDGVVDVCAGAPFSNAAGSVAGMARVYSGVDGSVLHTVYGNSANDQFGESVAGAGDVDGDGFADFVVGAPFDNSPASLAGSARVHSGRTGAVLFTAAGNSAYDVFGFAVAGIGDLNGDGRSDIVVGATLDDDGAPNSGSARVILASITATTHPHQTACSPVTVNAGLDLVAVSRPIVGTNFLVSTTDATNSATWTYYQLGFPAGTLSPMLNLQSLGTPACDLHVDQAGVILGRIAPVGTPTTLLSLPADPILTGATGLVLQSLCWRPTALPTFVPTDSIEVVIGHQ